MTRIASQSPADAVRPEQAALFAKALGRLALGTRNVGLAVSGGPDSMGMLVLAHAVIPDQFEVATVDHGLRPEAAEECALVARTCDTLSIRCEVLRAQVAPGNVLSEARDARYALLRQWAERRDLCAVATAHHIDDQAETFLMRLNRGSGVAGLAGVRPVTFLDAPHFELPLVRPVLEFRRQELADIVSRSGLDVVHDPSNLDDRFDRVRIRKALQDAQWLDPAAIATSAAYLAEAESALREFTTTLWSQFVRHTNDATTFYPLAPTIMRLRIVDRIIREMGGRPRGGDVARLVDRLANGDGGNLAGVLAKVEGDVWAFRPEPPRKT